LIGIFALEGFIFHLHHDDLAAVEAEAARSASSARGRSNSNLAAHASGLAATVKAKLGPPVSVDGPPTTEDITPDSVRGRQTAGPVWRPHSSSPPMQTVTCSSLADFTGTIASITGGIVNSGGAASTPVDGDSTCSSPSSATTVVPDNPLIAGSTDDGQVPNDMSRASPPSRPDHGPGGPTNPTRPARKKPDPTRPD